MIKFCTILTTLAVIGLTLGHVRVRQPPNRSSIFRDPNFASFNPPPNYDDDALYCGRVHQQVEVTNCGVCGDPVTDPMPRPNEDGGTFGRGIIVGQYQKGQVIPINVEFTTTHLGYFEMHLCDHVPETESCFKKLNFGNGSPTFPVEVNGAVIWYNTTIQLPTDTICDQCVLRLNYRAGNNWGDCGDGTEGMGCGLQETFRSCIDIKISQ